MHKPPFAVWLSLSLTACGSVTGIGVESAARIFYKANSDFFTASTTFAEAMTYTEQAALALGLSSGSVTAAWQAVGVGTPLSSQLSAF